MTEPIIHTMPQLSDEWFAVKLGKVSASHIDAVLAKGRTRELYMEWLVGERLSGIRHESYSNKNMEDGIETEPLAREAYELDTLTEVKQVGFVELNEWVGCSPDGLVGDDGLIEIKSVIPSTQVHRISKNKLPSEYVLQVQSQLLITGRKYCDFVSYCPALKQKPYWKIRVERDEAKIKEIEVGVEIFIDEMKTLIKQITGE